MKLKLTMVIPTYWARESGTGWKEGDAIYDHPTPLDREGTLLRTIQSLEILDEEDRDFQLVIIAAATAEEIEMDVERKVASIIRASNPGAGVEVFLFGRSHLAQIHELLTAEGKGEYNDLLQLRGYSNIRNLCLFIPHILGSDVAVLIDDDEVFEDPKFIAKAKEFIGRDIGGGGGGGMRMRVNAVAGYYLQPDGDYHIKRPLRPWMRYWDQYERMNEAFDIIIGAEPWQRLKETPFVFGGNMVIHRNLFTTVPFDPGITRGEDIDFLINARMFGFRFFLDKELSIKHLPPPKSHPTWLQLRMDIYRFIYERAKIEGQAQGESEKEIEGMTRVYPEDFDPYPGCFLKRDLEDKIEKACRLLSEEYLARGDRAGSEEALKNIVIARTDAVPKFNPFQSLCELQKRWRDLMRFTGREEISSRMRAILQNQNS